MSTLPANIPTTYRLALAMSSADQQSSARNSRPDARQLSETIRREQGRLLAFIRKRLPAPEDAEDIMQDVLMELVEAYELANPIERVASWLFAVARNKISDWYRRSRPNDARMVSLDKPIGDDDDPESPVLMEWLAVVDEGGPESEFFRETFMDALTDALAELPSDQREVFVQHELEGKSFNEMADAWKVSVNTLLSRKRYAVLHLRKRLRDLYDDFLTD
ncbi:RNA polymerase sigma factor [Spirosoma pomorum]